MRKTLLIPIIFIFLITTSCLSYVWAQEPVERQMRRPPELPFERMHKELNLTDQQMDELAKLRMENQKEMIKLRADLRILQLDLKTLLNEKEPDTAKVYAQLDRINKLRNEISKNRIESDLKRRTVFTPEQWDKIKNLRKYPIARRMLNRQNDRRPIRGLRDKQPYERRW
jgi:Spy/CpxP family protein refolding chaperone